MTKTLRNIFLCIVAAFAIGGIAYYLKNYSDTNTSGEMKKEANGAIDVNNEPSTTGSFNNKMTPDDDASCLESRTNVEVSRIFKKFTTDF